MLLDAQTLKCLELIENTKTGTQSTGSLFAVIDQTKTAMGQRLLRASLLQPLCNPELINKRLDAVDAIKSTSELFFGLQRATSLPIHSTKSGDTHAYMYECIHGVQVLRLLVYLR